MHVKDLIEENSYQFSTKDNLTKAVYKGCQRKGAQMLFMFRQDSNIMYLTEKNVENNIQPV